MPRSMKRVTVLISQDRPFAQVVRSLRTAGLKVEHEMEALGSVNGTIAARQLAALASLPGVAHVEPEQTMRIAPPDSPVQ